MQEEGNQQQEPPPQVEIPQQKVVVDMVDLPEQVFVPATTTVTVAFKAPDSDVQPPNTYCSIPVVVAGSDIEIDTIATMQPGAAKNTFKLRIRFHGVCPTECPSAAPTTPLIPLSPLTMGTAGRYGVLSGTATTIAGPTSIHGDFGQVSNAAITSSAAFSVTGNSDISNLVTEQAQADLVDAMDEANALTASTGSQFPQIPASGTLGGLTLVPGVYDAVGAMVLTGQLTFDAGGNSSAVWIVRSAGAFTVAAAAQMTVVGGGCASNIFFVVKGAATFGALSNSIGTNLIEGAITGGDSATFGPVLSATAAVTLSNNQIGSYCTTDDAPTVL
jgi:hypothetical protein